LTATITAAFLLVDKPSGWTSHDVVAKIRKLLEVKKVGHAGTLDPMATGLVIIGLGRATRLLRFVQAAPKEYIARAVFGVATDSLDADGAILERNPMPVDQPAVEAAMERFVGTIAQIPPMVSARKIGGRRLYELARQGLEVERKAREVHVYELELIDFAPCDYPEVTFRTVCSSGTYIRTLADDIARALGGQAHLNMLRRVRNGSLDVDDAATIDELEQAVTAGTIDKRILDPSAVLPMEKFVVDESLAVGVRNGLSFPVGRMRDQLPAGGSVALVDRHGSLIAVYTISAGRASPEVVIA
jgi:tRNA pseudouridine55 synthase